MPATRVTLNAQETRDLRQLFAVLHEHHTHSATVSFDALLGDDDVWTIGQEVEKWYKRLELYD